MRQRPETRLSSHCYAASARSPTRAPSRTTPRRAHLKAPTSSWRDRPTTTLRDARAHRPQIHQAGLRGSGLQMRHARTLRRSVPDTEARRSSTAPHTELSTSRPLLHQRWSETRPRRLAHASSISDSPYGRFAHAHAHAHTRRLTLYLGATRWPRNAT